MPPAVPPTGADRLPELPRPLARLTRGLNALGSLWIVGLMLLINADIAGRNLFATPVRGVTELVGLSIVGIVFLQLPDTLRCGRFSRADPMLSVLQRRWPAGAAAVLALHHLLGAGLMLILLRAAWPRFLDVRAVGEYVGAIGDFMAPLWPVHLVVLVGMAVTGLCFAWLAALYVSRALGLARGGA